MRIRVECGQRWYRLSSWFPYRYKKSRWIMPEYRKLEHFGVRIGVAFGPIMFFKKEVGA